MPADGQLFVEACALARDANEADAHFQPRELRRLDNYTKLALAAAARTLTVAGVPRAGEKSFGLIIASAQGAVRHSCKFMDSILDDGAECASPLAFAASVHNVLETYLTLLLNLRGPVLTVSQKGASFASALVTARSWLNAGRCEKILLGVVDEAHPLTDKIDLSGITAKDLITDDGAAFFLLTNSGVTPLTLTDADNDWLAARRAARRLSLLFTDEVVARVSADFVKTELARRKKNTLSVFAGRAPEDLLADSDPALREEVLRGLLAIFGADSRQISAENLSLPAALAECRRALNVSGGAFNFRSSGSTGEPVDHIHSAANLREEAEHVALLFSGIRRVVSVVPCHHAYGFLFGVNLPAWLGINAVAHPPLPSLPWADILRDGDLFVAFPMFLRQLADSDVRFPPGVTVVTATAPCPDALMVRLHELGAARVVENYGSSESGAIAFRGAGEPFRLVDCWSTVTVSDSGEQRLERIVRKHSALDIELPDIAVMRGEREFTISGRRDKAVQVAGVNVYPLKVADFLRAHELVKDAAVRLAADGEYLKAFVVLKNDADRDATAKILHDYLQALSTHEIPKALTFGAALPVTAHGKKADW